MSPCDRGLRWAPRALLLATPAALVALPAFAHGFGERTPCSVPLEGYPTGAEVAVAFSFALSGSVREEHAGRPLYMVGQRENESDQSKRHGRRPRQSWRRSWPTRLDEIKNFQRCGSLWTCSRTLVLPPLGRHPQRSAGGDPKSREGTEDIRDAGNSSLMLWLLY